MRYIIFLSISFCAILTHAQFKADNVNYTTVFPENLCKSLAANPGYILLDVRSNGEFDDTLSTSPGLNIGHIKNALHIDIRNLQERWKELLPYKHSPLFIYCSHSQRSRRASRLLSDSGFTKIFNVDGGLTNFYFQGIQENACPVYSIISSLPYKIISPKELATGKKSNEYFIVDIRDDSAFNGTTTQQTKKINGHFDRAVNIPLSKIENSKSVIPMNKPILVIDDDGDESPIAAKLLLNNGYKNVTIMFGGMDEWLDYISDYKIKPVIKWTSPVKYSILSAVEFDKRVKNNKEIILIDVRSKREFTNTAKNFWQNIGQIKNAINIPDNLINSSSSILPKSKNVPVIVYGFNNGESVYASALQLKNLGYKNVSVLRGGIWNLRWASHNIKGKAFLNDWVINVPEVNR